MLPLVSYSIPDEFTGLFADIIDPCCVNRVEFCSLKTKKDASEERSKSF